MLWRCGGTHAVHMPLPIRIGVRKAAPVWIGAVGLGCGFFRARGEAEKLRELRRQPGIGEYDTEMAWSYLCRRAPQVWRGARAGGGPVILR